MEKIYFIALDHDIYEDGKYVKTYSNTFGFWNHEPTDEEVEAYLLKKYHHWAEKIDNGKNNLGKKTNICWDVLEWDRIK